MHLRSSLRVAATLLWRGRYVLLVAWGVAWMLPASHYTLPNNNDWIPFEVAARTLVHYHHIAAFNTPALHLYADSPMLQFGPLPVYLLAAFQAFRPHTVAMGFAVAMIVAGVASLAALEAAALRALPAEAHRRVRRSAFGLALVLVPVWSFEVGFWHHLDDVIALLCICLALAVVARHRPWWQLALLAGTAAATKPWAVVLVPLLFALPRREWPRATLLTVATVLMWWAPFLIAAPGTVGALGSYATFPDPGSVLYLVGLHVDGAGWLRPLQLGTGMAAVGYLARNGRWQQALLAGSAVRILLDPFSYSYYVMGPLLGAFVLDLRRCAVRRLPIWSPVTLFGVWLLPRLNTHTPTWFGGLTPVHLYNVSALARLVWAGGVIAMLLRPEPVASRQPRLRPQRALAASS